MAAHAAFVPAHVASAAGAAAVSISFMSLRGLPVSASLPATAAIFAAVLTACALWREIRATGGRSNAGADALSPEPADPFQLIPGLVTRHDQNGNLVSVHGAGRRDFGFDGEGAEGTAFLDRIHVGSRISFLTAVDDMRRGERAAKADCLFACGGRETDFRPVRISCTPTRGADGAFSGFVATTTDATDAHELREAEQRWKDEALSANDAKTRFLAAVSHELRTPLNAILGFSDILRGEYFGRFENERQKEYVELIHRSGTHLLAVVNAMLDMSKIEAGRYDLVKEHFAIADAIHTTEEMLDLQARSKGVTLTTRVSRVLDEIVADRRALQQILINLAGNAIKFTPEGGVVSIDAARDGEKLVISVSDTGIGIAPEKLPGLGKPFAQIEGDYARQYEGTGLGLALVKGLVSLHGGTFGIESAPGEGTRVTIALPLDGEGDAGAEKVEFPPRLQEKSQPRNTGENRHGPAEAKIA